MQSYSVRHVTRETARWVAINPDTTDPAVLAHARAVRCAAMHTGVSVRARSPACSALVAAVAAPAARPATS